MNEAVQAAVTAVEPLAAEKKLALKPTVPAGLPEPEATSGEQPRCC